MSNNVSVPKEVFENVVAVLRMYAESEWGWDGEDNSVVRSWGEVYPEPKGFHFKAGGDMAKIALRELQCLLTQRAPDLGYAPQNIVSSTDSEPAIGDDRKPAPSG